MSDFRSEARRWLAAEPDADMREELEALIAGDEQALSVRFDGRLQFGTAGLRAAVGAGPQRMNRLVVQQAAAGLVDYLLKAEPDAATRGVIIGYDARRKSDAFALDTARVCAARGVRAMIFPHVVPTPVLAWNIVGVRAAAGVVVTASHNPPADNGYKVFTSNGAQIVSPVDAEISEAIDLVDPCTVPLSAPDDPLIEWLDDSYVEAYFGAVPGVRLRPELKGVPVAYSAMHGVGGATLLAAFERAGFPEPFVVPEQQEPDPTFPTVPFPNPEEPGAMDLLLAQAAAYEAAIALCNDPDADRLGAAIPTPNGGWRRLQGDEIGWLLADHILRHTTGDDRLVITTLVSSSLLAKMAAEHGVQFAETYTGFKWIGHTVLSRPELHFVFGYEQALGFLVTHRPLDKDGITAAVVLAEVAALARSEGVTLQGRLDAISVRFGRHVMADLSVKMPQVEGTAAVDKMRADPPAAVHDRQVTEIKWFDEAGLLRLQFGPELRLQLRPSGTEPKVKLYGEGIEIDPAPYLQSLAELLS
ncbi:MAG: phospho-sugar mutase [Ilumatobacteraceae bacterium]